MNFSRDLCERAGRPDAGSRWASEWCCWHWSGQSIPPPGNGHRRLTLHLAGQHQRALPHQGQLRACNGTCGDSQQGLGTPASCSPPPPLSFEPLSAWVRGGEAGLDFGGTSGKHTRRAWQSSPRSRAATVRLGRCNRWQQGGGRVGTVAGSGAQAWALCSSGANGVIPSSPTGPSAHLPVCLQGQLRRAPGSLFPLPRSQPLSGGGRKMNGKN